MRTVIRGGTVVTAAASTPADVLVEDGRITALGAELPVEGAEVIDATDRLVMPGFIDAHTHLDMPQGTTRTADDWASGTRAAAAGGTTTIVDFSIQEVGRSLGNAVDTWHEKAAGRAMIDYGYHVVVTDPTPAVLAEIAGLPALGIGSVKLFLAYVGTPLFADDRAALDVMEAAAGAGILTLVHAENGSVIKRLTEQALARGDVAPLWHARTRPPASEAEATARAVRFSEMTGAELLVVHVSCRAALEECVRGARRGVPVHAETCPQYVAFDVRDLDREGFEGAKYVCSPPLRDADEQPFLWDGLARGDIALFSSDHCPFNFATDRIAGRNDFSLIPNGIPGIEERPAVLWTLGVETGRITPSRFVDLVSTSQARLHGMLPEKGSLLPGTDADVVVWNPGTEVIVSAANRHGAVDYTAYEGKTLRGVAETVLVRGAPVVAHGEVVGVPGSGRFVRRRGPA
jgi:dihydropyrimidinase